MFLRELGWGWMEIHSVGMSGVLEYTNVDEGRDIAFDEIQNRSDRLRHSRDSFCFGEIAPLNQHPLSQHLSPSYKH